MDKETLAYLAGFFDGEGCVSILSYHGGKSFGIRLFASQIDPRPLNILKDKFGGSIQVQPKLPNRRTIYKWGVEGEKAVIALNLLRPYLVVKSEQADIVLEFAPLIGTSKKRNKPLTKEEINLRQEIKERLHRLKRVEYI